MIVSAGDQKDKATKHNIEKASGSPPRRIGLPFAAALRFNCMNLEPASACAKSPHFMRVILTEGRLPSRIAFLTGFFRVMRHAP